MKKLVLLVFIAGLSLNATAQNNKLLIKGLMAANQTANLNLESVSHKAQLINQNGNTSPNNTRYTYYVKRRMDNRSDKIAAGAKNGRNFNNMEVWTKDAGGRVVKYRLNNALIYLYSEHYENGKPPVETFLITYQNRTKI